MSVIKVELMQVSRADPKYHNGEFVVRMRLLVETHGLFGHRVYRAHGAGRGMQDIIHAGVYRQVSKGFS